MRDEYNLYTGLYWQGQAFAELGLRSVLHDVTMSIAKPGQKIKIVRGFVILSLAYGYASSYDFFRFREGGLGEPSEENPASLSRLRRAGCFPFPRLRFLGREHSPDPGRLISRGRILIRPGVVMVVFPLDIEEEGVTLDQKEARVALDWEDDGVAFVRDDDEA